MAARKPRRASKPRLVRKTVTVDAEQLAKARRVLNIRSDAEVLRYALEHLVGHFEPHDEEE